MKYRSEFPRDARARVEAARLRAYEALEQDLRGIENWRRDDLFLRCVMRVFMAFVVEACEFGKRGNHGAWSDRELDQRCREFLLWTVVEAWEERGKDLRIRKMFSSSGWGYSINDDARGRIEKSPEWKQYQELLMGAFEAQSARAADWRVSRPDKADCPPTPGRLTERSRASGTPLETEAEGGLAKRSAMPIPNRLLTAMRHQGLSGPQLAERVRALLKQRGERKLKVDRTTIYRLINGETKNPNPLLWSAVTEVLKLSVDHENAVNTRDPTCPLVSAVGPIKPGKK